MLEVAAVFSDDQQGHEGLSQARESSRRDEGPFARGNGDRKGGDWGKGRLRKGGGLCT